MGPLRIQDKCVMLVWSFTLVGGGEESIYTTHAQNWISDSQEEVVELNMVIAGKGEEIRDLEVSLTSLKDSIRIAEADSERQLAEANAKRAKQDEVIAALRIGAN